MLEYLVLLPFRKLQKGMKRGEKTLKLPTYGFNGGRVIPNRWCSGMYTSKFFSEIIIRISNDNLHFKPVSVVKNHADC